MVLFSPISSHLWLVAFLLLLTVVCRIQMAHRQDYLIDEADTLSGGCLTHNKYIWHAISWTRPIAHKGNVEPGVFEHSSTFHKQRIGNESLNESIVLSRINTNTNITTTTTTTTKINISCSGLDTSCVAEEILFSFSQGCKQTGALDTTPAASILAAHKFCV